ESGVPSSCPVDPQLIRPVAHSTMPAPRRFAAEHSFAPGGHPVTSCSLPTRRPDQPIRAPHGSALSCKGWPQEAALRMLMNNLDPDVAERWEDLVVYGGFREAARGWGARSPPR